MTARTVHAGNRIGVTGHQVLPAEAIAPIIDGIRQAVADAGTGVVGVASLAAGSDQIFAREILAADGQLHIVLPCQGYESTFQEADRLAYRELLQQATTVETLAFTNPCEEAYYAAGHRVVDLCQRLIAVWDGKPARGLGGTADAVIYAQELGREVHVIWPKGVTR